jgi:hypothetical protein
MPADTFAPASDVVADYIEAEANWHAAMSNLSNLAGDEVDAARDYIRAIDAYVAVLRATGRQIPHHMDEVAETLRHEYGEPPPSVVMVVGVEDAHTTGTDE